MPHSPREDLWLSPWPPRSLGGKSSAQRLVRGRLWSSYLKEAPFLDLLRGPTDLSGWEPASYNVSRHLPPTSSDPNDSSFQFAEFWVRYLESKLDGVFKSENSTSPADWAVLVLREPTLSNFLFYQLFHLIRAESPACFGLMFPSFSHQSLCILHEICLLCGIHSCDLLLYPADSFIIKKN